VANAQNHASAWLDGYVDSGWPFSHLPWYFSPMVVGIWAECEKSEGSNAAPGMVVWHVDWVSEG
tara:strand:+ start:25033 stop:25224 length:192 start_codon:yes stop_codon:yes gene_type:complete